MKKNPEIKQVIKVDSQCHSNKLSSRRLKMKLLTKPAMAKGCYQIIMTASIFKFKAINYCMFLAFIGLHFHSENYSVRADWSSSKQGKSYIFLIYVLLFALYCYLFYFHLTPSQYLPLTILVYWEVSDSRIHPRCGNAHSCLGPMLERW